jgi:bacillithiol system protein YtxJ
MADIERISEPESVGELLERSKQRPVWIFKHSLTCGTSAAARRRYEQYAGSAKDADFALLEVQKARPLSQAVADATGVRHQSPQAILLRGGRAVWHSSHGAITADAMQKALAG